MTNTDEHARQVRKSSSPEVGLFPEPRDRLRLSAAVCPRDPDRRADQKGEP